MRTNTISKMKNTLFGFSLLCAMGSSIAGPFPGSVNIHHTPGFTHANAKVHLRFSSDPYYYPSHGVWPHSRVLRTHPRERFLLRDYSRYYERKYGHKYTGRGHRHWQHHRGDSWSNKGGHERRQQGGHERGRDADDRGGRHRG